MKIATKVNQRIARKICELLNLEEVGGVVSVSLESDLGEGGILLRVRTEIVLNEDKSKALAQALGISDDDEDDSP